MKRFLTVLMIMVMIPYVTTMAWTGRIGGGDFTGFEELAGAGGEGSQGGSLGTDGNGAAGRRYVAVEREGKVSRVPAEDFLVHVLAAQIPADFGPETLKAQAVIARTYIYREMDGAEEIPEEALDMDALSGAQMEELWGGTYQEDYSRIREAVSATSGLYLAYEGEPAEVFFCRAASGATRPGGQEHPCLRQAESPGDLLADGYLSIAVFTPEDLARRVSAIPGAVSPDADRLLEGPDMWSRSRLVRRPTPGKRSSTPWACPPRAFISMSSRERSGSPAKGSVMGTASPRPEPRRWKRRGSALKYFWTIISRMWKF